MTTIAVKERPILFNGPMIRAILADLKGQTRRIIKPQPELADGVWGGRYLTPPAWHSKDIVCPYGKPGDRLWVRESCWLRPERTSRMMREGADTWPPAMYAADDGAREWCNEHKWIRRNSIHMPRRVCRILLEVSDVRVERLQSISEEDAKDEGVEAISVADVPRNGVWSCRQDFAQLWDSINGKTFPWLSNPFVWVVSFRRLAPPVPQGSGGAALGGSKLQPIIKCDCGFTIDCRNDRGREVECPLCGNQHTRKERGE
jgi:hypothetical protein